MKKIKYPVMLYDGECILCTRYKDALSRLPGTSELTMISIHEPVVKKNFSHIDTKQLSDTLHIITSEKEYLKGADAVEFIIKMFPLSKNFSWLIESGMGQKAISFFHKSSEKYREYLLNRCPRCKKKS